MSSWCSDESERASEWAEVEMDKEHLRRQMQGTVNSKGGKKDMATTKKKVTDEEAMVKAAPAAKKPVAKKPPVAEAVPASEEKNVNGVTEKVISRYYEIDQQHKALGKERESLGDLIKKAWPDNEMHILGSFSAEKKVTEAKLLDKDILYKLLTERIGQEEADEMFEMSKETSKRVSLTVKKAAS